MYNLANRVVLAFRCTTHSNLEGRLVLVDMLGFPKEQHVLNLLSEAVIHASTSGDRLKADVASALHKAREVLEAPVTAKSHLPLVLSAARRHVSSAEKHTVARIIGSEPVNSQEMASLVRLRLICAELLNILTHTLAELKPPHHRNRDSSHLPGFDGWQ